MCLYPRMIINPKYKKNKKNGGNIPPIHDQRVLLVPIGCGKCIECRKRESNKWKIRLAEEVKHNTHGKFITLTFSNESICKIIQQKRLTHLKGYALDNAIATVAVRMWLERWRKKYKKSLKHWLVTELGHHGTENIHLHGIVWTEEHIDNVRDTWNYGYVWPRKETKTITYVNDTTINYITKYITKIDVDHKYYKSKILTSPGIGSQYTISEQSKKNQYNYQGDTKEYYITKTGFKMNLPIYYRNKIYTEQEREYLWLEKLDKQKRYILGREIDTSNNLDDYKNLLDYARERNEQLGYGNDKINYDQKYYEEQLREIMYHKRQKLTKEGYPIEWDTNTNASPARQ